MVQFCPWYQIESIYLPVCFYPPAQARCFWGSLSTGKRVTGVTGPFPLHSSTGCQSTVLLPTRSQELLSHFWNTRVILVLLNLNRMSYLPVLKPWEFPLAFCARKWFVWETGCGMKLMWRSDLSCAAAALVNVEKCCSGFLTFEYQLILYAYWMTNW